MDISIPLLVLTCGMKTAVEYSQLPVPLLKEHMKRTDLSHPVFSFVKDTLRKFIESKGLPSAANRLGLAEYTLESIMNEPEPREFSDPKEDIGMIRSVPFEEALAHEGVTISEGQTACKYCSLKLMSADRLRHHIASTHARLRRYACTLCGKRYRSKDNAKRHQLVHSYEMNFLCDEPDCQYSTRYYDRIKNHLEKYHPDRSTAHLNKARPLE